MARRSVVDELEQGLAALLAGAPPAAEPGSEAEVLLALAEGLRGLPREGFRTALGTRLARRAAGATEVEGGAMKAGVGGVKEGFRSVTPYLVVRDVDGLVGFARRAFGAVELERSTGEAGGTHVELRIGDSKLMMGGGEMVGAEHQKLGTLHLYVPDVDVVYARALEAGAASLDAPGDREYGDRDAAVRDPYGNEWYIGTHLGATHVPEGLHDVNVYLHPQGAGSLMDFLKRTLGAEELERHGAAGVVHHGKLRVGNSVVELGEARGKYGPVPAMLFVYVEDVDAAYAHAVAEGAEGLEGPKDQPYGDRVAHVKDPAGNSWYLATPIAQRT